MVVKAKKQFIKEVELVRKEVAGPKQEKAEREQASEALQELEEEYRSLVENSVDGIVIVRGRKIVFANKVVKETSGYSEEELKKLDFIKLIAPSYRSVILKRYLARLAGLPVKNQFEIEVLTKEGRIIPCEISSSVVTYQGNKAIQAMIRDITERKKAEEAVRESEKRYRTLFESKLDGVFVMDAETMRVVLANQAAAEMYGFSSAEEVIGVNPLDFVAPEERERTLKLIAKDMFEKDRQEINEFRTITKDGKEKWISALGASIEYEGKLAGLVSFRDITERKKAERALRESEESYRDLFENMMDGLVVHKLIVDENGNPVDYILERMNSAAERILGWQREDIEGKRATEVYGGETPFIERYARVAQTGKAEYFIDYYPRFGRWYEIMSFCPEKGYFANFFRDITEREKAQEQLEHSFINLAETVSRAMATRDPYTAGHQRRVAELARLVGEKMGLDKDRLRGLYIGGLLHDIGKVSTPEVILSKPGELTEEEWDLIHAHAKQGYIILKGTDLPWPVADMALHHHERVDGSGYPDGVSGDEISLECRILGVCDVVEAMSSHRPYRPARSLPEILKELRSGRGTKYDANVVDVMLEIIEGGEFELQGSGNRRL